MKVFLWLRVGRRLTRRTRWVKDGESAMRALAFHDSFFSFYLFIFHYFQYSVDLLTSVFQYSVDLLTSVFRQFRNFSLFHTTFSWQQYVFRNFSLFHTTFSWQQYVSRNFSLFHTTFSWQQYVLTPNFFTFSNQMSFSY